MPTFYLPHDLEPGRGYRLMIGTSIFLIALGVLLYFASIESITVGVILVGVGVTGLVISLLYAAFLTLLRWVVEQFWG